MSRKYTFSALAVALGLVAGACGEQADPTSANDAGVTGVITTANAGGGVVNHASLGGADICEALGMPTGCDANFSLTANQKADGSVSGQWQDTFAGGGEGIHVAVDCLNVFGNGAVVGGVITHGTSGGVDVSGQRALTAIVDNGTSAKDPADQLGFSVFPTGDVDCTTFPGGLFALTHGQVKVRGGTPVICNPDESEPDNDSPFTGPTITIPADFVGTFCGEGDVDDWFQFSLDVGATLEFTVDWDNPFQDVDVIVLDTNFSISCGFSGATLAKPETFVCELDAGDYLLLVEDFSALAGNPGPVNYHVTILEP